MKKLRMMNGKGQMSFDLGFAIILILIIMGSVQRFTDATEDSITNGQKLMTLNMIGDYTYGNLNSFYISLIGAETNASYTLTFLDEYLYSDSGSGYLMSYEISGIDSSDIVFKDSSDPALYVRRELGFEFDCLGVDWDMATPGSSLVLENCKVQLSGSGIPGDLSCRLCQIT
jgi:hypothetical protein